MMLKGSLHPALQLPGQSPQGCPRGRQWPCSRSGGAAGDALGCGRPPQVAAVELSSHIGPSLHPLGSPLPQPPRLQPQLLSCGPSLLSYQPPTTPALHAGLGGLSSTWSLVEREAYISNEMLQK